MPINVSEALDMDTASLIVVVRQTGSYVGGIWTLDQKKCQFKTIASVQQPTAAQLKSVRESERTDDMKLVISKKPIHTGDDKQGRPADEIIWRKKRYKIVAEGDWSEFGHNTVIGARVK